MAKNWTIGEAARVVFEGTDTAAILDIGRRFPLFAVLAGKMNEAGVKMLEAMPDYITARKAESALKGDVVVSDEDDEAEVPAKKEKSAKKEKEKPVKKEKPAKKAKPVVEDDDDDDFDDDDDEEEVKPAKKAKKAGKPEKKAKKPVIEDDDDDDDDFDFDDDDDE